MGLGTVSTELGWDYLKIVLVNSNFQLKVGWYFQDPNGGGCEIRYRSLSKSLSKAIAKTNHGSGFKI